MRKCLPFCLPLLLLVAWGQTNAQELTGTIKDASVITGRGGRLLIAQDENPRSQHTCDRPEEAQPGCILVEPRSQSIINRKVKINWVHSDGSGWIVIHLAHHADIGRLGKVVGHAHLDNGLNRDVLVKLDIVPTSPKVWAVYYVDKGTTGKFEAAEMPDMPDLCESPDRPTIICQYGLRKLLGRCGREHTGGVPASECYEGMPVGTFLFTVHE